MFKIYFADYYCAICDISFSFKSKYERHLQSEDHVMFKTCSMSVDDNHLDSVSSNDCSETVYSNQFDCVSSNDDLFDYSKVYKDCYFP